MVARFPIEDVIIDIESSGVLPRLLLHCCCAPCASYVLEYLSPFFEISALFYNPNIMPWEEHGKREAELIKLLSWAEYPTLVRLEDVEYDGSEFEELAERYWDEPEGGERCRVCFELRLGETAKLAASSGFDYFATTLSVSPHKDAALLNEIGGKLAELYGVKYLDSDFKKRDGYKRSVELSKEYGLYRQGYCGCKAEGSLSFIRS